MSAIAVDRFDLALLNELQREGRATNAVLGERIGLSASQVSRRIQRLEEAGVLGRYAALLDPDMVGLGVLASVSVSLERHGIGYGEQFEREIAGMPEVIECLSVTGEADYVLRVVAPDLDAFSEFMMKYLLRAAGVVNVKSSIALKKIKHTHVLPLEHVKQPEQAAPKLVFSR